MKQLSIIYLFIVILLISCSVKKNYSIIESGTNSPLVTKFSTVNKESISIDFYGVNIKKDSKRPIILMVGGSKCIPLFLLNKNKGKVLSSMMFYESLLDSNYNINFIGIEKRNIKSFDTISTNILNKECTDTYGLIDKNDKIDDVITVIKSLKAQGWTNDIYLMGHSDGADIISGVAFRLGDEKLKEYNIKALAFLSSGGPTRYFEKVLKVKDSHELVQKEFDKLLWLTSHENLVDSIFDGDPIKYHISFTLNTTPLDEQRKLNIPIFIAHGTNDTKVNILSDDLLVVELLRNKERKIKYLRLKDLDHSYSDSNGESHQAVVIKSFLNWIKENYPREVETK